MSETSDSACSCRVQPLAIAQQPPRDFLTAERGSVSVKV